MDVLELITYCGLAMFLFSLFILAIIDCINRNFKFKEFLRLLIRIPTQTLNLLWNCKTTLNYYKNTKNSILFFSN